MISSNTFGRIVKCYIALPCQWKREWIRTFSRTGFLSIKDRENGEKNIVNKKNKQSSTSTKTHVKTKTEEKHDIATKGLSRVQRHMESLTERASIISQKSANKTDLEAARLEQLMKVKKNYRNIQKHVESIQESSAKGVKEKVKMVDKETKKAIMKRQRNVPQLKERVVEDNREENKRNMSIQRQGVMLQSLHLRMQKHIRRVENINLNELTTMNKKNEVSRINVQQPQGKRDFKAKQPTQQQKREPSINEEALQELIEILNNFESNNEKRSSLGADTCSMETWNRLQADELNLQTTYYPRSAFEEMIRWTEKGTLWKFPINNEQGMEEEENVHFSEHIFLDQHLEEWCPTVGPIRHFMELVCLGLSKNPYLTVQEKVQHIMWYNNYFTNQSELLEKLGAWDTNSVPQLEESSSLEEVQQQQSV